MRFIGKILASSQKDLARFGGWCGHLTVLDCIVWAHSELSGLEKCWAWSKRRLWGHHILLSWCSSSARPLSSMVGSIHLDLADWNTATSQIKSSSWYRTVNSPAEEISTSSNADIPGGFWAWRAAVCCECQKQIEWVLVFNHWLESGKRCRVTPPSMAILEYSVHLVSNELPRLKWSTIEVPMFMRQEMHPCFIRLSLQKDFEVRVNHSGDQSAATGLRQSSAGLAYSDADPDNWNIADTETNLSKDIISNSDSIISSTFVLIQDSFIYPVELSHRPSILLVLILIFSQIHNVVINQTSCTNCSQTIHQIIIHSISLCFNMERRSARSSRCYPWYNGSVQSW